ncbi:MAG TPA: porin [Leptospiraceae bacterium]|nr:porin [Leptospiraceae bacterium]HNF13054.1 porin [Leptospiraceae bacterium]HNM01881.1 porin [Leptospiraceae bacterium]HNN02855.1 porin [Leptospiraceae bacterium]HNO23701.1 porin [Leptospiraceae bacterium]
MVRFITVYLFLIFHILNAESGKKGIPKKVPSAEKKEKPVLPEKKETPESDAQEEKSSSEKKEPENADDLKEKTSSKETEASEKPSQENTVMNPKDVERMIQSEMIKASKTAPLQFGVFGDVYYSMNMNYPKAAELNYSTQAVRNNEFNINLAFIDAKLSTEKVRGRLAFQYGTSVNANYTPELNQRYSNQLSVRNIQEAYAGIKIGKKTWVDAGIYFGNIGFESWISGNNWLYTRALVLDYVPYYSTGVRISHEVTDKLNVQFHLMNGWSNITDNNRNKAVGMQVSYKMRKDLLLTYNNFIGNEIATSSRTDSAGQTYVNSKGNERQTRYYHNFIAHWDMNEKFSLAGSFDVGFVRNADSLIYSPSVPQDINKDYPYLRKAAGGSFKQWYNGTVWLTYKFIEDWRISGRLERYIDAEQANVPIVKQSEVFTKRPGKQPNGFQVSAVSVCLDYIPSEYGLMRVEAKYMKSADPIFEYRDSGDLSRHEKKLIFNVTLKHH